MVLGDWCMLIYVVFRNRTATLRFNELLEKLKIRGRAVSTPKKIIASCGLSVELDYRNINKVLFILKNNRGSDFVGVYRTKLGENVFDKLL